MRERKRGRSQRGSVSVCFGCFEPLSQAVEGQAVMKKPVMQTSTQVAYDFHILCACLFDCSNSIVTVTHSDANDPI